MYRPIVSNHGLATCSYWHFQFDVAGPVFSNKCWRKILSVLCKILANVYNFQIFSFGFACFVPFCHNTTKHFVNVMYLYFNLLTDELLHWFSYTIYMYLSAATWKILGSTLLNYSESFELHRSCETILVFLAACMHLFPSNFNLVSNFREYELWKIAKLYSCLGRNWEKWLSTLFNSFESTNPGDCMSSRRH